MTITTGYIISALLLFGIGMNGLMTCSHQLRKILAVNLMASGVFLILIVTGFGTDGSAIDHVPHAMVLTGIVISVSTTALALTLACRIQQRLNRSADETAEGNDDD
ncbi:MAG: NADH-quinone oxidoreductase subunit K [Proteobacteria bacterium]|nr:NADH-quinone oxidoreductase subunit K [Pseudomonadota bacterium]MBU1686925.1 NADH-quinone oxidoreductase subunit K [Pseudomonadota bacterium]